MPVSQHGERVPTLYVLLILSMSLFPTIHGTFFPHVRIPQLHTISIDASYLQQTQIVNNAGSGCSCEEGIMKNKSASFARDAEKLRSKFLRVLRSRRTAEVPLTVEPAKPVKNPLYQIYAGPTVSKAMESCPKVEIENFKSVLKEENLYLRTEAGEQGRLPMLILSLKRWKEKRPAIVILHSTHKNKEYLRPLLEAYASRGYVAVAIDARYHGERATNLTTYQDALVTAWRAGDTMPFMFDTVWDLIKLADYLTQREDIDPTRIGITGESMGGQQAWLAGAADTRYSVFVPVIGVRAFRWAIDNDQWEARVNTTRPVFEEALKYSGKSALDKILVKKVWNRIAPGIVSTFDSPNTIPAIAPRPLLIVNGDKDPLCPLASLEVTKSRAIKAYGAEHASGNFKLAVFPGVGHEMTALMVKEVSDWF